MIDTVKIFCSMFLTGPLIHVDFGYAFGTGTSTLPIPEIVPFRATRTFLGALEPLDAKEWLEARYGKSFDRFAIG